METHYHGIHEVQASIKIAAYICARLRQLQHPIEYARFAPSVHRPDAVLTGP